MTTPTEMARKAAEQLEGSSKGIYELGPEYEVLQNNSEFCAVLDQLVFCCECCDNWFETGMMAQDDEWICEGCAEQ